MWARVRDNIKPVCSHVPNWELFVFLINNGHFKVPSSSILPYFAFQISKAPTWPCRLVHGEVGDQQINRDQPATTRLPQETGRKSERSLDFMVKGINS